jgi:hypothetical protein
LFLKKRGIIASFGILFLVLAVLGCGYGVSVEEMNRQYFISAYGFDTSTGTQSTPSPGSFSSGSIGPAGVEEMNQEYFESRYGFEIGDTSWSHFGAGTDWSNFGASVIPVQAVNTIGMQETTIPLAGIALAILLVTAGLILPKRNIKGT